MASRFFFLLTFLCTASLSFAQTVKTVKLKATAGKIRLQHFSINQVVDDRADTADIGSMRAGMLNKPARVTLENGATAAVAAFVRDNTLQDPSKDAIELHILKLQISESASTFREQADLVVQFGFFRNGKKIIDYSGSSNATSGRDVSPYIGKLVSQSIENVLQEFDRWWPDNRALYDDSKKDEISVKVFLEDSGKDPDQIVFNNKRPLQIEDFQGSPDKLSIALAATYSGLSMQYEVQGDNTGTRVGVTLTPFFDKTKSWMKSSGKTPYVLQHEQLHFYITAIKAYELIQAIRNYTFTTVNVKEELNALQKRYSKETEALQAQYDQETTHGTLKDKQRQWEARIGAELQAQATAAGY